ncbi:hypothetical protein KGF56_001589 [Candida oxycetoniae]|uniref:Uncharacterized protein n=1 Tax=Candida oxycetoniae TaxID=497107 RepID=A0AAI9SYM1_9ASCO|nr:uncharacterized protein KGF56_001589 [Candida oxycetoniae]KAI3405571.2 hypothetical protein KGF56_001589 [Candida oxycetoniae]
MEVAKMSRVSGYLQGDGLREETDFEEEPVLSEHQRLKYEAFRKKLMELSQLNRPKVQVDYKGSHARAHAPRVVKEEKMAAGQSTNQQQQQQQQQLQNRVDELEKLIEAKDNQWKDLVEDFRDQQLNEYNKYQRKLRSVEKEYGYKISKLKAQLSQTNEINEKYKQLLNKFQSLEEESKVKDQIIAKINIDKSSMKLKQEEMSRKQVLIEQDYDAIVKAKQALETDYYSIVKEKQAFETDYYSIVKEKQALETDYYSIVKEKQALETNYYSIVKAKQALETKYEAIARAKQVLEADYNDLLGRLNEQECLSKGNLDNGPKSQEDEEEENTSFQLKPSFDEHIQMSPPSPTLTPPRTPPRRHQNEQIAQPTYLYGTPMLINGSTFSLVQRNQDWSPSEASTQNLIHRSMELTP